MLQENKYSVIQVNKYLIKRKLKIDKKMEKKKTNLKDKETFFKFWLQGDVTV